MIIHAYLFICVSVIYITCFENMLLFVECTVDENNVFFALEIRIQKAPLAYQFRKGLLRFEDICTLKIFEGICVGAFRVKAHDKILLYEFTYIPASSKWC